MRLRNPNKRQAQDAYYQNKRSYNRAQNEIKCLNSQITSAQNEKKHINSQINNQRAQKINFQKRLDGIEKIIAMLEGTGGWFCANIPHSIEKTNKTITKSDEKYNECFKSFDTNGNANLKSAFSVQSVNENYHSSQALQKYKNERDRLSQEIDNLNSNLDAFDCQIRTLSRSIDNFNDLKRTQTRIMNNSSSNMNYYRRFM